MKLLNISHSRTPRPPEWIKIIDLVFIVDFKHIILPLLPGKSMFLMACGEADAIYTYGCSKYDRGFSPASIIPSGLVIRPLRENTVSQLSNNIYTYTYLYQIN